MHSTYPTIKNYNPVVTGRRFLLGLGGFLLRGRRAGGLLRNERSEGLFGRHRIEAEEFFVFPGWLFGLCGFAVHEGIVP